MLFLQSGPHPGMRAAAAEQSKQTRGSGKGMMGVILPMYAVGIVVYLVYTLFKVRTKLAQFLLSALAVSKTYLSQWQFGVLHPSVRIHTDHNFYSCGRVSK